MIYINKDAAPIYVELSEALDPDSNHISQSLEDYRSGAWVLLSDEQLAFREANPDASVKEIFEMQLTPPPVKTLDQVRQEKIAAIYEQDQSSNVFYVQAGDQHLPMWLDKNTRNSLLNITLPAEKAAGNATTTLWYEGQPPVPVTVSIAWLEEKLPLLELYAKRTYDLRNCNLATAYACTTIDELEALDPIQDYPEPEIFTLNMEGLL